MNSLTRAIARHAVERPNALAIDGGQDGAVPWGAMPALLEQVGRMITADLADADRPVALAMDHGIAATLADVACLTEGIATVPIPSFFTPTQRDWAIRQSGAMLLLKQGRWDRKSASAGFESVALQTDPQPLPAGTAKISFTSGSTGQPKGICLSRDHMLAVAGAVVDFVGLEYAGRHLALLPSGILLEDVAGLYACLFAGGTYVALSQAAVGLDKPFFPDFAMMAKAVERTRASSLIVVPEYLNGLVTVLEKTGMRLPQLSLIAVGGARLAPAIIERAMALGLPVRQGYGLTECASVVALETGQEAKRGSVGRSLGLYDLHLAPDGEILIDGPVCLGTVGGTAAALPHRTGDIGRIDEDGLLWIEGRKSNRIITAHGRNISPEWVEGALLSQPAIAQAMVYGEAATHLSALVVPSDRDANITAAIAAANDQLPVYAQVQEWQLVPPFTPANRQLTGNGRLRRAEISQAYLANANQEGTHAMAFYDRLLDETKAAQAELAMVPQLQAGVSGRISLETYIAYLTEAFHHVRHTVPLLRTARDRLGDKPAYVDALNEYIEEEWGHEQWILNDIGAAGGNMEQAERSAPRPATAAMIDHAYAIVQRGNPAALFGMVHVLEGTSVAMADHGARAVQVALGLPPQAFTYLTSHGALDKDHVRFFAELMNSIKDKDDQQAIIEMARDMYRLFANMFAGIPMEGSHAVA